MSSYEKFNIKDIASMHKFIQEYGFATICAYDANNLEISHSPLLLSKSQFSDELCLTGHLANQNNLKQLISNKAKAKVVFHGPHAYISPTWYSNAGVPTWNYAVVHVEGAFKLIEDNDKLLKVITELSNKYEQNRQPSWNIVDFPTERLQKMMTAIFAFEISIEKITAKFKISQNKSLEDKQNVITGLLNENSSENELLAKFMKKHS